MVKAFFDIVGTCVGYEAAEEAVALRLGPQLARYNLDPKLFFHFWLVTVERDSAFMVFTQRPKDTNVDRWLADLPRCLFQSGVPPSDIEGFYTKADVDYILEQYLWHLRPRPGFKQMLETLTRGGIEFHACSGAKPERLQSYFKDAGISIPEDRICDMAPVVGVHKPQLAVYKEVYKRHAVEGTPIIFGASHAWDLAGAKQCGFVTAYTLEYEHFQNTGMWGQHDVVAPDLAVLGDLIVERCGVKD